MWTREYMTSIQPFCIDETRTIYGDDHVLSHHRLRAWKTLGKDPGLDYSAYSLSGTRASQSCSFRLGRSSEPSVLATTVFPSCANQDCLIHDKLKQKLQSPQSECSTSRLRCRPRVLGETQACRALLTFQCGIGRSFKDMVRDVLRYHVKNTLPWGNALLPWRDVVHAANHWDAIRS